MANNPYAGWQSDAADDDEGGAFAVPAEVTWTNGFGDEDLAGAPPRPAQPAPRPAQPAPPVAAPRPVAPATSPPAPSAPAAPAAYQSASAAPTRTPVTGPIAPPAPAQTAPAAPNPAARPLPAPTQPVTAPQAAPVTAPATAPVSAPAPLGDTEVPDWAQYRPSTQPTQQAAPAPFAPATAQPAARPPQTPPAPAPAPTADLTEPDWAQVRPSTPAPQATPVSPAMPAAPPAQAIPVAVPPQQPDPLAQPVYPDPTHNPEPETRKGRRGKGAGKSPRTAKPAGAGKGKALSTSMAGGRWKVMALRGTVYSICGLLLLGGLKNVLVGDSVPDTETITNTVRANLGETGFPTKAAEGFAVRFASVYLNYDPATAEQRAQALEVYSPEAADGTWGWTGSTGRQKVITGPVVAAKPVMKDAHFATVTVAAQVESGAWVYLAVPVYAATSGALVVSGPPAFVAPPARAENPGQDPITDEDGDLATVLADIMPGFFRAWAASNAVELARYTAKDATPAATSGLAGAATLDKVGQITMPKDGGNTRVGQVEVSWAIKGAGTYLQTYQVTVTKDASEKWSVKDITGGVVTESTSGASEGVVTPTGTP